MKINWNQKYFTIAAYATLTVIVSALAIMVIFNFDAVAEKLSVIGTVATPIIIGIFCAYLLNPLMVQFERGVFGRLYRSPVAKKKGTARALAVTCTMLTVVIVLTLMVLMVIPQLVTNIVSIFSNMNTYIDTVRDFIDKLSADHPDLAAFLGNPLDDFSKFISDIWKEYSGELLGFAGNVASGVWAVLDTLKNVIMGLIISIYLLAKKEMFIGQSKKLLFAFVKPERAQRFLGVCREASKKFLGSIIGKIIEALIVALIVFLGCTVMGMPYSLLIAAIMFIFNLIPFVGPFIGCVPCVLLLLLSDSPIKALWFVIFIIILQNLDGNIIAPLILGDSTGLPAVWILIAILIGGGLFGILGMFLGVPVCAVIYMLVKDYIEGRLKKRALPPSTNSYVGSVDYITPDYKFEDLSEPAETAAETKGTGKVKIREKVRTMRREYNKKHSHDD
ncbi:MAG: AI-2E family transporter [Oscillospiraceae bacterium]